MTTAEHCVTGIEEDLDMGSVSCAFAAELETEYREEQSTEDTHVAHPEPGISQTLTDAEEHVQHIWTTYQSRGIQSQKKSAERNG